MNGSLGGASHVVNRPVTSFIKDLAARTQHATGTIRPYVADMTKAEEVSKLFQWVDTALGGITVLVNNAGVFSAELLQDTETAKIEEVVNVNLTAVMLCCREAMNNMKKHDIRDGHIVNINSLLGHSINGMMPLAAYTATKHAITGFSRALRLDVQKIPGFKLRVSAISPAAVITDMVSPYLPESMHDVMLPPREVANAVIYVISCPLNVEVNYPSNWKPDVSSSSFGIQQHGFGGACLKT